MSTFLLTITIRRKRDMLLLRRRARQVARLLGLDVSAQTRLACGVFEVACRALEQRQRFRVRFLLAAGRLHVEVVRPGREVGASDAREQPALSSLILPALDVVLPAGLPLAGEDVRWVLRELRAHGAPDWFEEVRKHNRELFTALVELARADARQGQPVGEPRIAAAA
jgi:hypothetical protein